jgi:uncharacterized protein YndB with AHSA1/START domain
MNLPDKIERTLFLPVPVERVWQAISTPEGLSNWFSNRASFTQEPGSPLQFEWQEYGTTDGCIERIEPPTLFAYRWRAHGASKTEPLQTENSTLVTFSLEDVEGGTQLTVVETGFTGLNTAARKANYQENVNGWRVELQELADYLVGDNA